MGADGARALAASLERKTTLKELNLSMNGIGDDGARALATSLERNMTLETLDLRRSGIGADGARALAASLERNKTLETLDLRRNDIGDDGARALAASLEKNTTLVKLGLAGNDIGDDVLKALEALLKDPLRAKKAADAKAASEKAVADKAAAEKAAAAKRAADEEAAVEKAAAERAAAQKAAAAKVAAEKAAAEKAAAEKEAANKAAAAKKAADDKAAAAKAATDKAAAAAANQAVDEKAAAAKAATDKAASEKATGAAAAEAAEELRRRATALGFLQMLTSLNVAEDSTLKMAVVWCDEKGATSVSDIVECDMVDDFVRHLGLKPIPDKRLRNMLQASTAASSSSSPSPQFAWDPLKPTFYFLSRAAVLSATAKQLKRMQELRDSKLLEKMAVDLNEAFQGKGLIQNVLFVSHRWEDFMTPDETGAQLAALKAHLMSHPEVQYVWFDYSCMPQRSESAHRSGTDDRTPAEKAEFDLMLKAIADLYLTAKVLILLDTAYRTRFWTTMEGWCAMQQVTPQGVRPARAGESRVTVSCIHNATEKDREALLEMSTKTPAEMSKFLASPDVFVTNKKDKETMLPIVGETDKHVREMMSGMHSR
eukprot:jgi/Chrpa1/16140/Chrysochromulina_OHIO_Genome00021933-RA